MEERLYIYSMKRIILHAVGLLLLLQAAHAQKSLLALDEHNKYIYYQVVGQPGATADSLDKKAVNFIRETYPKTRLKSAGDTSIVIKDRFVTYSVLAFAKHESGEIKFTLNIECKNSKYRYWLTDFVFTPYEKNRYGVFAPKDNIEIPLEKASSRVDSKELDGYFDQTGTFCKQLGDQLKSYMLLDHPTNRKPDQQPPVKKVVTDKW
jgi:hypothetical protein